MNDIVKDEGATIDVAIERAIVDGDLSRLGPRERVAYYRARCESAGLDPLGRPFEYLRLNGKLVLYANKNATDQLCAKHGLSVSARLSPNPPEGCCAAESRVTRRDGTWVEDVGAVPVHNLRGEALCNAVMKAVTKAKRRCVLSACGLGMLDETEALSIPGAAPIEEMRESPRAIIERVIAESIEEVAASRGDGWEAPEIGAAEINRRLAAFLGLPSRGEDGFDEAAVRAAFRAAWRDRGADMEAAARRVALALLGEGPAV